MKIEGSTALVTGSARRIGRSIAVGLAKRGGRIAIHCRQSTEDAESTLAIIRELGVDAAVFQADLTDDRARERMIEEISSQMGHVNILVNNASTFAPGTLGDTTPEMWDEQMDVNARGPFFLAQACGQMMLGLQEGKIVNIADPAGETIWPEYLPYSVSKAALLAVTRGLARSLAPFVQVNAVSPGPVHFPESYTQKQKEKAIDRTLLKRSGNIEDVVRAVVFLIENDYVTGEVLHVDGGRHIF